MHRVDVETSFAGRVVCVLGRIQSDGSAVVDRAFDVAPDGGRTEMDIRSRCAFVQRHGAWLTSIMLAAAGVDEETAWLRSARLLL